MAGKRTLWIAAGIIAAGLLAAAAAAYRDALSRGWQAWRYPVPQGPAVTPLGEDILRRQNIRAASRFAGEYRKVRSKLDAAQARGVAVAALQARLDDAAGLARQGYYRQAMGMLNAVEMSIPRPRRALIPANPSDTLGSDQPKFRAARVSRKRRRRGAGG